ncbi:protease inhibitor I42 family protein [Roseibacillus persicicus]|uniref:Uncharacterized protein n=1 Tax=Roseibacillus persicicus TaxID=454148 RepID=A0A918TFC8_9BACT|nr:protease inhibitor I42 family protein [Roseibacillus persicicus]GHC42482.1 hypothetical protein GCM10007100_04380 [Roseibacillus persicicus]
MLEIDPSQTNTLVLGQEAKLSLKEHGSVGIRSAATSADESVLSVVRSRFEYRKPAPRNPGGDAGTRSYLVTAKKVGATTIVTQRIFRGSLEKEHFIHVVVVNP